MYIGAAQDWGGRPSSISIEVPVCGSTVCQRKRVRRNRGKARLAGFVAQKQGSVLTEDPGSISTFKRK